MVGMGVGLEYPFDLEPVVVDRLQHAVGRFHLHPAVAVIEVENGVDRRRDLRCRIGNEIADGIGRFVEEAADQRAVRHRTNLQSRSFVDVTSERYFGANRPLQPPLVLAARQTVTVECGGDRATILSTHCRDTAL
jgi:hypothetical protein